MKEIRDSPSFRDIDVREILSDVYESVSVDHRICSLGQGIQIMYS